LAITAVLIIVCGEDTLLSTSVTVVDACLAGTVSLFFSFSKQNDVEEKILMLDL